jgi:hypothetical protein
MKQSLSLLFVFCIFLCSGQQPVITKLDKKVVTGTLIGGDGAFNKTYIGIKKNKHYWRSSFVYHGRFERSKGKWKIRNDTLVLTEKFYKEKSYNNNKNYSLITHRKHRRTYVVKLILYKGRWMEIEDNKYIAKQVFEQYIQKGMTLKPKNAEVKN